ncbi:hypothetical protein [Stackebrandtia nassauensis]|uniref:ABM domain-containing protein n=1 Tax=Stackebrandtia nassauensis (strain DSM 44728 / CIP 108903 / NRRL B-16338 / NBRC 102104 / LLR-40K-21) TaxID=446470 RepID=D3QAZ5_STANL|nr:hypothetical protein [Stackebrandtia nassauensis]ADD44791.1 hypothetical protein Snas_5156 [Stackebrandtia nassauensis DSM 44728]
MIARMWEVRGLPERIDELVDWVCATAVPRIEDEPGYVRSEVYASEDRVVVISSWRDAAVDLPEAPPDLVARPPHAWDFNLIDRHSGTGR